MKSTWAWGNSGGDGDNDDEEYQQYYAEASR